MMFHKHDGIWRAGKCGLLAVVCLAACMVQDLRCCCVACVAVAKHAPGLPACSTCTGCQSRAVTVHTCGSAFLRVLLMWHSDCSPRLPAALVPAQRQPLSSHCQLDTSAQPGEDVSCACWHLGLLPLCWLPADSSCVQATAWGRFWGDPFGTCRHVGLVSVSEPSTRRLCICRPLPASEERAVGGPNSHACSHHHLFEPPTHCLCAHRAHEHLLRACSCLVPLVQAKRSLARPLPATSRPPSSTSAHPL